MSASGPGAGGSVVRPRTSEGGRFREQRRAALVQSGAVSGLDFVEASPAPGSPDSFLLTLHFLTAAPASLQASNVAVRSPQGMLETGFSVGRVHRPEPAARTVELTVRFGDPERAERLARDPREYRLELPGVAVDPFFASAPFRFDGEPAGAAVVARAAAVEHDFAEVDYLAKDYDSFRRLMLERMTTVVPEWSERNPADLGVAIVEVLANAADYLSYYQDAVATEAYLDTARKRSSVRRHLRLLGHTLHEGCNARVWVQIEIEPAFSGGAVEMPAGTRLLTRTEDTEPAILYPSHDYDAAIRQGSLVFETLHAASLRPEHGRLELYAWGAGDYDLPAGAVSVAPAAHHHHLEAGDVLIFEQARSPAGDQAVDTDPGRRHPARLAAAPRLTVDPLTGHEITEIELFEDDAPPFPLTVAATTDEGPAGSLAAALGNVVLADHGETVREKLPPVPATPRWRPTLGRTGLTRRVPYDSERARRRSAASALRQESARALPALMLRTAPGKARERSPGGEPLSADDWLPRTDLLDSHRFARHLVVETESDGRASLRFGDSRLGSRPAAGAHLEAIYRVGNGPVGHVGPDSLGHVVVQGALPIAGVRNPLASAGAEAPESLERARLVAPRAFRERRVSVTADDCAELARRDPEVLAAACRVAWTGSWSTLFLTVQRRGGRPPDEAFERRLRALLEPSLLAGRDLEVRAPAPLGLEIALRGRLEKGFLRETVRRRLLAALSDRRLPGGGEGFFHPDRFELGRTLYLGELLDAAMKVRGVALIEAEVFRPSGAAPGGPRVRDRVEPGPGEVVSVRNLPSAPELGSLSVVLEGGS